MDRHIISRCGLPQGSALSPILFNHIMDLILSELNAEIPGIDIAADADETAILKTNDIVTIERVLEKYGLISIERSLQSSMAKQLGIQRERSMYT